MKINIANPATGCQKLIEVDDERKLRVFYDKRISAEVEADILGDEFKGYVLRITGGNDKQGFPMMQGVLVNHRVRLLLSAKHGTCYRPRRKGERRRKSVRGCIVGPDIAVLNCIIVKQGENPLPGLTDKELANRLGPKRASKIRKLFNLDKNDDVRKFVVRRILPPKEGKQRQSKAPKIQRLVTPLTLQRKRRLRNLKIRWAIKSREEAKAYAKLMAKRRAEAKAKREALISKRRASSKRASSKRIEATGGAKEAAAPAAGAKPTTPAPSTKKAASATKKAASATKKAAAPAKKAAAPTKKAAAPAKKAVASTKKAAPAKKAASTTKKAAPAKKAASATKKTTTTTKTTTTKKTTAAAQKGGKKGGK